MSLFVNVRLVAEFFERVYKTHFTTILGAALAGMVILAWVHRFIQDDAFISFRYAENFVRGYGLVWNASERIEGYTNFLWTLLVAGGMLFGAEPISFTYFLGLSCFLITLVLTFRLTRSIVQSNDVALAAVLLLGTNYTFSSYATGGLETQLQACLFIGCCAVWIDGFLRKSFSVRKLVLLSLLLTLALLTRLDSALLVVVLLIATLFTLAKENRPQIERARKAVVLLLPIVLIVGGWMLWKLSYYGDVLPNSFYVKASSLTSPAKGMMYLYTFLVSYFFVPIPIIVLAAMKALLRRSNLHLIVLAIVILIWLLYVVKIGGDFMEFRMLVPVMPLIFIIGSWAIFAFVPWKALKVLLILIVVVGNIHHAATFRYDPRITIEDKQNLYGHLTNRNENWAGIGKTLRAVFNGDTSVIIATTAAGAIPFYSRLRTVDMFGINDRWISERGFHIGDVPGHQRISPVEYLQERKVNLVFSHPLVLKMSDRISHIPLLPMQTDLQLTDAWILEIPIDEEYKVLALYMHRSMAVDAAIEQYGWRMHRLVRR